MSNIFVTIILPLAVTVFGSGGMWTFLDHMRQARGIAKRQITAEEQAERDIVKALARYELVRASLAAIEANGITVEEADALTDLYEPYVVLGGNGNGKRLYEQAMALPRRNGRSAGR